MTFESLLAGLTFAHCAFKGAHRGTKFDAERATHTYTVIYIRMILHSSTISVGLAQARPNNYEKALKCKPSAEFDANIGIFGFKTPLHAYVLGDHEHTSMKN